MAILDVFKKKKKNSKKKSKRSSTKEEKFYEIIENGGLRVRYIIEIVGKPEDHVNSILDEIKEKIKKSYLSRTIKRFKAKKIDFVYQGFIEGDTYFKDFDEFVEFVFTYYPSSIEIIEPDTFSLDIVKTNSFFNDLLLKIHQLGFQLKNAIAENEFLKRDLNRFIKERELLVENLIVVCLHLSRRWMDPREISKITGLQGNLEPYLTKLVNSKKIITENGKYMYNFSK